MRAILTLVLLVVLAVAAGCGSSPETTTTSPASTTGTTSSSTPAPVTTTTSSTTAAQPAATTTTSSVTTSVPPTTTSAPTTTSTTTSPSPVVTTTTTPRVLTLTSPAFAEGETVPDAFTCSGRNVSPELAWDGVPEGTVSFALIVDDPDAPGGTFTHWVLFDIPGSVTGLDEGVTGLPEGVNDFGVTSYRGPCPPAGPAHRYFFKLYALDSNLGLPAGAPRGQVLAAIGDSPLGYAELVEMFAR